MYLLFLGFIFWLADRRRKRMKGWVRRQGSIPGAEDMCDDAEDLLQAESMAGQPALFEEKK